MRSDHTQIPSAASTTACFANGADGLSEPLFALMQYSEQAFGLFDETDTLRYGNPRFRTRLGLDDTELPTWTDIMRKGYASQSGTRVDAHDFEKWLTGAKLRRGKVPYRTIETEFTDGTRILTTETTMPNGWMLCVMTDISQFAKDHRELRYERDQAIKSAYTDELTGLCNRRYVMERLKSLLADGTRSGLAAIILDIDHFKRVNDTFGHDVGDIVLKAFADQLAQSVHRDDVVGRMGGEEFLVLIPSANLPVLQEALTRLFAAIRDARPLTDQPEFRFTCSAGAAFAQAGESADELLCRADKLLYAAKHSGRDQFIIEGDAPELAQTVASAIGAGIARTTVRLTSR
jgi:diguanylate cyclase (GGDEF)-like protein